MGVRVFMTRTSYSVERNLFSEPTAGRPRKSTALRCPAPRKHGVAVSGHPFNACVEPLGAPEETFCDFAILLRASATLRKPVICPIIGS